MTFKTWTKQQRKQINAIMNVDDNLTDEDEVIAIALKFTAEMCDDKVLATSVMFYIDTDESGSITLERDV